jgi:hypothetical protein
MLHMLQVYVSNVSPYMLQQVIRVVSVFISRHGKRAWAEVDPMCMYSRMACVGMPATRGTCGRMQQAHTDYYKISCL